MSSEKLRVFTLWLDDACVEPIRKVLSGDAIDFVAVTGETLAGDAVQPPPNLIICGEPPPGQMILEFAQYLSLTYQAAKLIYVSSNKETYDRVLMRKNGFSEAFLIPFEIGELTKFIEDAVAAFEVGGLNAGFRAVRLVDFTQDDPPDFDTFVFLPMNRRFIRLTKAGQNLRPEQISRFEASQLTSIHIKRNDVQKFYQFCAARFAKIQNSEAISETERQEKLQEAVRSVVSGVFSCSTTSSGFDSGQTLMKDCQEIVTKLITQKSGKQNDLFHRLVEMSRNDENIYSSAVNVSTFSALLSMGLGVGKPEDIALAAMIRDIGLAELPPALQTKRAEERTPEEETLYRKHPEMAVNLLKSKKMLMSDTIIKTILQHHENVDGTGYPAGLRHPNVVLEAQLIGIADMFDQFLATREGQKRLRPREAVVAIIDSELSFPTGHRFDPGLLNRMSKLLLE